MISNMLRSNRRKSRVLWGLLALPAIFPLGAESKPKPNSEWPVYGGDPGGMRYSTLKQIHRGNVSRLERAWTYHHGELVDAKPGERLPSFQCTPIVVDGTLYLSTPSQRVIALDAETG